VHSNENLDDIANAPTDYQIEMKVDKTVYSYNRFKSKKAKKDTASSINLVVKKELILVFS
jgi:hypothetical protein